MSLKRSIVQEAAHRYAELGYPVFPCLPGGKQPLTEHGFHDASTDANQIDAWWAETPAANIGIPTEGLLVLDIDVESTWLHERPDWELELAVAPLSMTPSGGRHSIFRQPSGTHWRCTQSVIAPHVDTRGDGGLFVAPPSALPGGRAYRWALGNELDVPREALPEPPNWLSEILDRIAEPRNGERPLPTIGIADRNVIPAGQRNATLARLAGTMRRSGMSVAEIQAALVQANEDRCQPPLDADEVVRIAGSIGKYAPDEISVALAENHFDQMVAGERSEFEFQTVTSRELATSDYRLEYLIDGVLVRGQPMMIGGPKKSLKTNTSVDLALSLGQSGLFLGRFNVHQAVRTGVMSGESGAATIQETALRIARTKDYRLAECENVVWAFEVPQLNLPAHMAALRRFITENELEVLILDPTYLMMLGIGNDAGNLFVVGQFLKGITDLIRETGCTPILCHHLKKNLVDPHEPAELDSIAWAGFAEFVRQWMLLNRRVKYDPDNGGHHEMWMSFGGSAGHSSLWGVNVDEGTSQDAGGRRWDVEVMPASEAYSDRSDAEREAKERRREQERQRKFLRHREAVWQAVLRHPEGETSKVLRTEAKLIAENFQLVIHDLVDDGEVELCTIQKVGRKFDGYRPIPASDQAGQTGPNEILSRVGR